MQTRILTAALVAALAAAPAMASMQSLLPPQHGDLQPTVLLTRQTDATLAVDAVARPHVHVEHAPVSVSWPLPHDAVVQARAQPYARSSREYWRAVTASELQQGVSLPLSAPGAVIRVSPGDAAVGKLTPAGVQLQMGGHTLSAALASRSLADASQLQAAGMAAPAASLAMQLKPELGAGTATLRVPAAQGRYLVHVFEPQSPYSATARADHANLLQGQSMQVRVALDDAGKAVPLGSVGGQLRAPDGRTTPLSYQRQADGSYVATVSPRDLPAMPGLWEVHSYTDSHDGGHDIRRDTTTVFSAAVPDARFTGMASVTRSAGHGIDVQLGVTAQQASRYAASAILYGRDARGRMVPAAYAQSAAWLPAGQGHLVLRYSPRSLAGISAPYELHNLRLLDQPVLGLLERRALALRFIAP